MNDTLEILRRARREKGITLKELSKISGVSLGTVNKLFSGAIASVKVETAMKLANALNVDMNGSFQNKKENVKGQESYGFVRCAAITTDVKVGDIDYNVSKICEAICQLYKKKVEIAVFPELCITSYSVGDLFFQETLLQGARDGLVNIINYTKGIEMLVFVGFPLNYCGRLYNCAAAICNGKLLAVIPKKNLPDYNEFNEKRWFCEPDDCIRYIDINGMEVPFGYNVILQNTLYPEQKVACEICEDIWVPDSPSIFHSLEGASIIVNLSASNEVAGKSAYRRDMVNMQASKCLCSYIYTSSGFGESTSEVVFSGHNLISECGRLIGESLPFENGITIADVDCRFIQSERNRKFKVRRRDMDYAYANYTVPSRKKELIRHFAKTPFVPEDKERREEKIREVLNIQSAGLAGRIKHINASKLVLGLSGGLDSTLAMLVCERALKLTKKDPSDLICITMPCFGTSNRTHSNAQILAEELKCTFKEIDIKESVLKHFEDIGQDKNVTDVTYENSQARERTQVLMDYANKVNGIVIGTGDLSEIALGWSTYNGDQMSMYNVNAGVPKTLIKEMVLYFAEEKGGKLGKALKDVAETPVSPELKPLLNGEIIQATENFVGPYILNDFFMYYLLKHGFAPSKVFFVAKQSFKDMFDEKTIYKWMQMFIKRFFNSQFKRSASPDGPKTGALNLSCKAGFKMPSDACFAMWKKELESIEDSLKD